MSDTIEQGRAYVAKMRERGQTDAQIETALLAAGWAAAHIAAVLEVPVLDLWQASAQGDARRVSGLLNQGGEANAPGPEGLPIH